MIYKKLSLLILFFATGLLTASAQKSPQDMDRFIDALMKKMTTEEKIGQLNLPVTGEITTGQAKSSDIAGKIKKGEVGGLFNLKGVEKIREVQKQAVEESRLGIPLLFGMDVIHGYETMFPIPLGLSCTWDMAAIEESARIAAVEASADGISWTFSPMVDISRDPRWGRVSEGNGEDPFLGAMIAEAMVRGYQGKDMKRNDEIMACVKHFALYGASEAGRDYNTVDMSRQRMFNDYMLPYEAAVEAGVGSVMASFNEVDGIPATANKWLMTDILRGQWGFNGFVVTDYTGISEMIDHGIGDLQTVTARAINAGVDMDMVSEGFVGTLKKSIQEGKVSMETLNTACRRILVAKYKLGLFDNPYKYCDPKRPARDIFTKAHRDAARRIAAESFVLLKNDSPDGNPNGNPLLPFNPKGNIAVIGPLANSRANMPGTWSVAAGVEHTLGGGLVHALLGHDVLHHLVEEGIGEVRGGGAALLRVVRLCQHQRLGSGAAVIILRDDTLLPHIVEQEVPAVDEVLGVGVGVIVGGILGDGRDGRALPEGQLADILVEVLVCRRLDALDRTGKADGVQVGFQNGLLGVAAAQDEGAVDLAQLAQCALDAAGALVAGQVLDELLFQRRGALLGAVDGQQVFIDHRADGALEVDARLVVKVFVLGADECIL